ncbi:MAG TPA: HAD-IIB family hydrolase [Tepidisphaeraceae bacterium]
MSAIDPWLFGLDLDGTTLSPDGGVTPRTINAIAGVLAAGHKVAFATGRNYIEAQGVFEATGHFDLAVLVSGAVVVDTRTGHSVRRSTMNSVLAAELCGAIERLGHVAVAYQDRHAVHDDYVISRGGKLHPALGTWLAMSGQRITERDDLARYPHEHTFRISTVLALDAAAALKSAVEREFAGRAHLHGVIVASEGVEIVEMFDPRVNKWQGLLDVADLHGIDPTRIVAVGDDHNDLPMIRNAPIGVAMGNARDELKAATSYLALPNADDGLALFLEACRVHGPPAAAEAIRTPRR